MWMTGDDIDISLQGKALTAAASCNPLALSNKVRLT
jgi:hypothetical protein